MNISIEDFYNQKFNKEEGVGYQFHKWDQDETKAYRKNQVLRPFSNLNGQFHFYAINPIDPLYDNNPEREEHNRDLPRVTNANVTALRTFLVEFDDIPLKTQTARVNKSGMPYTAKVYSGSDSYHYTITLDESFGDGQNDSEYRKWHKCIENALLQYDLQLDPKCNNPARLSRAPGAVRPQNGKLQKLEELKEVVSKSDLHTWLRNHNCDPDDVQEVVYEAPEYTGRGDASDDDRFAEALRSQKHFNGEYGTTSRQPWLYELASWCKAYELSKEATTHYINSNFSHDEPKKVLSAINNAYKYSKKSNRTLMTRSNPIIETNINLDDIIASATNSSVSYGTPWDERINQYAWIGTKLYLIHQDGEYSEFNTQGFKARFGPRSNPTSDVTRRYVGFGYEPNYLSMSERCSDGSYNTFRSPNVNIKKGNWKHTEILLRHIFGDQYELGLEYYWVKRHRPLQALPALCLVGDEDAGKTTIGQHQQMVYCNSSKINSSALEQLENNYAHMCQDIIIEESTSKGIGKHSNPQAIVDKIKDMVTSCGSTLPIKKLYSNVKDLPYYGKVMMFTNDVTPIKMSGQATRFWVRKIGMPEKHENFLKHLKDELGHFLWYLDNEFVPTRQDSKERLWFHPDEYWTEDKDAAKHHSGSKIYKAIRESLIEWFKETEQTICYFDLKSMASFLSKEEDVKVAKSDLRDVIENEFKWTQNPKRAMVTDSLNGLFNPTTGQNKVEKRRMDYWMITENLKSTTEEEEYFENLLDYDA